tara:strand:- start:897 stop:1247 length:351 start_codon:yes stop_codon:yes gene_type:complete
MSEITLECPFNNGEHNNCDFKTHSEVEYLNHTKSHNPIILKPEERLWEKRLQVAIKYATNDPKKPWMFAKHMWDNKPKNMFCNTLEDTLMDFGIVYNDIYIGLAESTGGFNRSSNP